MELLSFSQTLRPLAFAPLAGLAVLTCFELPRAGYNVPFLAARMAPLCYGAAALFVLPVLVVWPSARRPNYFAAAIWGAVAAWIFMTAIFAPVRGLFEVLRWPVLSGFGAAGAVSGLLYSRLVQRISH